MPSNKNWTGVIVDATASYVVLMYMRALISLTFAALLGGCNVEAERQERLSAAGAPQELADSTRLEAAPKKSEPVEFQEKPVGFYSNDTAPGDTYHLVIDSN